MVRTAEHSGDNGVGVARTTDHLREQFQRSRGRCAHAMPACPALARFRAGRLATGQPLWIAARRAHFQCAGETSGLHFEQRPLARLRGAVARLTVTCNRAFVPTLSSLHISLPTLRWSTLGYGPFRVGLKVLSAVRVRRVRPTMEIVWTAQNGSLKRGPEESRARGVLEECWRSAGGVLEECSRSARGVLAEVLVLVLARASHLS